MRIEVDRDFFHRELRLLTAYLSGRLTEVRIHATAEGVTLLGAHLATRSARVPILPARVDQEGWFDVDLPLLTKGLQALPKGRARMSVEEAENRDRYADRLRIEVGGRHVSIAGHLGKARQAGTQLVEPEGLFLELPLEKLRDLYVRVADATTTKDEGRFRLDVVRFEVGTKGDLIAVATDSHRMAVARLPVDAGWKADGEPMLVSRSLLNEVLRFEGISGLKTQMLRGDVSAALTLDGRVFAEAVGKGSFPDWRAVLRAERPISVTVERERLIEITSCAKLMSCSTLMLRLAEGSGIFRVAGRDQGTVVYEDELDVVGADADQVAVECNANPVFLRDAAIAMEPASHVSLFFEAQPLKAFEVRPAGAVKLPWSLEVGHLITPIIIKESR
jgi:hypothetical protein